MLGARAPAKDHDYSNGADSTGTAAAHPPGTIERPKLGIVTSPQTRGVMHAHV